eukprot:RCo029611
MASTPLTATASFIEGARTFRREHGALPSLASIDVLAWYRHYTTPGVTRKARAAGLEGFFGEDGEGSPAHGGRGAPKVSFGAYDRGHEPKTSRKAATFAAELRTIFTKGHALKAKLALTPDSTAVQNSRLAHPSGSSGPSGSRNAAQSSSVTQMYGRTQQLLGQLWAETQVPQSERDRFIAAQYGGGTTPLNYGSIFGEIERLTALREQQNIVVQRIFTREAFLQRLQHLAALLNLKDPSWKQRELQSSIVNVVLALRKATCEVVTGILSWRASVQPPRPFLWNSTNYMLKMQDDVQFLEATELPRCLRCTVRRNPFLLPARHAHGLSSATTAPTSPGSVRRQASPSSRGTRGKGRGDKEGEQPPEEEPLSQPGLLLQPVASTVAYPILDPGSSPGGAAARKRSTVPSSVAPTVTPPQGCPSSLDPQAGSLRLPSGSFNESASLGDSCSFGGDSMSFSFSSSERPPVQPEVTMPPLSLENLWSSVPGPLTAKMLKSANRGETRRTQRAPRSRSRSRRISRQDSTLVDLTADTGPGSDSMAFPLQAPRVSPPKRSRVRVLAPNRPHPFPASSMFTVSTLSPESAPA